MLTLGQAMAIFGTLIQWNALADPYCSIRYLLISILCLSYVFTTKPGCGFLSVFGIVYLISLMGFSAMAGKQVCWVGKNLSYFTGVFPCFLVFICYTFSVGDKWEKIANSYIVSCLIVSLIAIAQIFGYLKPQGDYFDGRVYACIGSPVFLSGVLAMAIPLCLERRITRYAIPVILTAILFTQSRSGLVASVVGILGYAFLRKIIGIKTAIIISILAIIPVIGMFSGLRNSSLSDRGRYHMMRIAASSILEHPFGIGPERFGWALRQYRDRALNKELGNRWSNSYAHNQFLEALVAGGPIFLSIHLILIAGIGLFLYRTGNPGVFGTAMALCAFSLMQPTPLLMKCVLASLLGCLDPSERVLPRAPFIAMASLALMASLSAVTMSKIFQNGLDSGLAQMVVDSYKFMPSAAGDQ